MITLNTDANAKLTILMPHQNKALAEAIAHASPVQLEQIKEGKDLKSIVNSLFNDKINNTKSDQVLLDILKNSTVFKQFGNFTDELKSLMTNLKENSTYPSTLSKLETSLSTLTSIDSEVLKEKVANSGIFMESKIAAALKPLETIRQSFQSLQQALVKSPLPEAHHLARSLQEILSHPSLSDAANTTSSAKSIVQITQNLVHSLQQILSKSDPIHTHQTAQLIQKFLSDAASEPAKELTPTLTQLYSTLLNSKSKESNQFLDATEKLLITLKQTPPEVKPLLDTRLLEAQFKSLTVTSEYLVNKELHIQLKHLSLITKPEQLLIENQLEETLSHDVKSQLLALSEELKAESSSSAKEWQVQVDKLITQIDYHQLISHLNASNSLYIPFSWDQLEEGSLSFKKGENEKFYCEINLSLKEYGKIDLMMALYDHNQLEIQAYTERSELKELIQNNLPSLRSVLISAGVTPRSIRIMETKEVQTPSIHAYAPEESTFDGGFEVKV